MLLPDLKIGNGLSWRSIFFTFVFSLVFTPLFLITTTRAFAKILPMVTPSGYTTTFSQLENNMTSICYPGWGRAVMLYWPPSATETQAEVAGLGIYVATYPDRWGDGPLDPSQFRLDLRKGYEPPLSDNSNIIFTDLAPASVLPAGESGEGINKIQTSLLFFAFPSPTTFYKPYPEVPSEDKFRTAYISCKALVTDHIRYALQETNIYEIGTYHQYDDVKKEVVPSNQLALNLFLFAALPTPSPTLGDVLGTKTSAISFHPLVLIHGLGGKPDDWINGRTNYQTFLRDIGYPDDYVHYYSYGYKDGVYNYQGDIREIALGLEDVVKRLSIKHKADGGDGKVDLLGFSLGGVVARQYLATHLNNHKVNKLITIGSPHKGAWVLGVDNNIKNFPLIGKRIEKSLAVALLDLVNRDKIQRLDKDADAIKQIYPNSDFLEGFDGINKHTPQDMQYATFYGDIHAAIQRKLFHLTLTHKVSIGDGLILPESATGIPSTDLKKFPYSEEAIISLKLEKLGNSYALKVDLPNSRVADAFHTYLLDRSDLRKDLACSVLEKNYASLCK